MKAGSRNRKMTWYRLGHVTAHASETTACLEAGCDFLSPGGAQTITPEGDCR